MKCYIQNTWTWSDPGAIQLDILFSFSYTSVFAISVRHCSDELILLAIHSASSEYSIFMSRNDRFVHCLVLHQSLVSHLDLDILFRGSIRISCLSCIVRFLLCDLLTYVPLQFDCLVSSIVCSMLRFWSQYRRWMYCWLLDFQFAAVVSPLITPQGFFYISIMIFQSGVSCSIPFVFFPGHIFRQRLRI